MSGNTPVLSEAEKEHFLEKGWVKIPKAFTKKQAEEATKDVWTRLGMSPTDKSTWSSLRTNMPAAQLRFDASEFAPRAWAAATELCGGEERIDPKCRTWWDTFIVNLGTPENEGKEVVPKELDNYHVDGDFFVHYLDSPEQGLLIIPLFTDVVPGGGGTYICPDAMPKVASWLYDHPEGVSPRMVPRGEPDFEKEMNLDWFLNLAQTCEDFVEVTGEAGDVYLLHPLMLHSASTNPLRRVRIITNPPVFLKEPFCFDRPDGNYSLVERRTIRALGKEAPLDWKIKGPREAVVPARVRRWEKMKAEEARRLEEARKLIAA
ncbi:uncharacterized protein PpBr36_05973 [Pyricularia pennisetigena]|uniref:uncharacterized protein n=1 Tax=Pyricularia pennisetigena TaxID=1578925 RepID=UPI00114EBE2C|nr:uncharacterized protein PpBr36_05973 [Pyricularia pennisetigena]TLS23394.1 hypothetical protein PpBr36_05973 [Pyricularia pennisetigena]